MLSVKEIVEKGLSSAGMKTIVLMDGCAAKSVQVHFATINDALPGLADLMTTEEAKDMLIAYPCSECKPKKVIKRTKARKRFTMFDHVKRLRIAMIDKWVSGNSFVRFLDRDHDGMITYDEFYDFMHQFGLVAEAKVDPEEVFNILDTQGLGEVPTDVLLEALHFTDEDLETEGRGGLSDAERLPPFPSPFLIGLVAHNNMKPSMMKFVKDHLSFFSRVKLVTTGSTGRALSSLGLNVEHLVSSGPLGGDQEIGGLISQGKVAAIFFFTDPLSAHPHAADIEALNRICCVHDTIFANNPSTAKALVTALENSPFGYSRLTGLNPNIGREADVVTKYKEGQAKVIQSVSAKTEAAKSAESSQPETVQEKTRKSILRAPRKDTKAPIANYGDFIKRTRKSVVFH
jgi:methylglyoxal synthase